jgi:hypothetical protein
MSVISGTLGAILGAQAQERAADKNAQNVRKTNELNYRMFRESRGEGGSAVLPLYLRTKGGQLFESKLGEDTVAAYEALTPRSVTDYRARVSAVDPLRRSALSAVSGIFDGTAEAEAMERFKPVAAARKGVARQAAMESLARTMAEIQAANAASGTGGDSMAKRLLEFEANKGMARDTAAAELMNLEEERAIGDQFAALRLQNASLPYELARQELAFFQAPDQAFLEAVLRQQEPLRLLYLGPGSAFRNEQLPMEQPQASAWQLLAQSGAATGNMALNYFLSRNLANQWAKSAAQSAAASRLSSAGLTPATANTLASSISSAFP